MVIYSWSTIAISFYAPVMKK